MKEKRRAINRLSVAIEAAEKAGEVILRHFRHKFSVSTKRNQRDLLTSVDLDAEKTIINCINKYYPTDSILSEETRKDKLTEKHLWLVDPIDGTTNFVSGVPLCCVSIAWAYYGKVMIGVVYHPFTREVYCAERGKGAYLYKNNKNKRRRTKLSVSKTDRLISALVSFDYSSVDTYRRDIRQVTNILPMKVRGMRIVGSAALEFAWVGGGFLDAYLSRGAHPWDVAAGALVIEEAGGKVTDWKGNLWKLDSGNFLASNDRIHEEFLQKILGLHKGSSS